MDEAVGRKSANAITWAHGNQLYIQIRGYEEPGKNLVIIGKNHLGFSGRIFSNKETGKMQSLLRQSVRAITGCFLAAIFAIPPALVAQVHVVSPAELQQQAVSATQLRQHNLETVRQFLSSPRAEKAMESAHMDTQQVKTAISSLNDRELASLASRAEKAQADFAAGRFTDRDLIIIIIAIAALVLIIVAVR